MTALDHAMAPAPETRGPLDVWFVEDNTLLRETVSELLDCPPVMRCSLAAATCEQALAALRRGVVPHVILMDLGLPGMSGVMGIGHIRAIAPSVSVIVLTVHEDDDNVFEALCAGATGYLLKPASAAQIVDAVHVAAAGGSPMNAFIARRVLTVFSKLARPAPEYGLTDREREILHLAVEARTKRQIADMLILSPHTVDSHLRSIYHKLQVHSRSGAVAKALRERLV